MNAANQETTAAGAEWAPQGMDFDEAVAYVVREQRAAFTFTPVFEEDDEGAAGAQLFVLVPDALRYRLHYVAGPFYYRVYVEDEIFLPEEVPQAVKSMRFLPSAYKEDLFEAQLQDTIKFLMENSAR